MACVEHPTAPDYKQGQHKDGYYRKPKCSGCIRARKIVAVSNNTLNEVTLSILDSLGVDEKPNQRGQYTSTPVQAYEGGTSTTRLSWNEQIGNLKYHVTPYAGRKRK